MARATRLRRRLSARATQFREELVRRSPTGQFADKPGAGDDAPRGRRRPEPRAEPRTTRATATTRIKGLEAGDSPRKKQNALVKSRGPLTEAEAAAVRDYTKPGSSLQDLGGSDELNRKLRAGEALTPQEQATADALDAAIARTTLPTDVLLHRGVQGDFADRVREMKVGDRITGGDHFQSATLNPSHAFWFAKQGTGGVGGKKPGVEIDILARRGQNALPLAKAEAGVDWQEVILPRSVSLRYVGDREQFGRKIQQFEIEDAKATRAPVGSKHEREVFEHARADDRIEVISGKRFRPGETIQAYIDRTGDRTTALRRLARSQRNGEIKFVRSEDRPPPPAKKVEETLEAKKARMRAEINTRKASVVGPSQRDQQLLAGEDVPPLPNPFDPKRDRHSWERWQYFRGSGDERMARIADRMKSLQRVFEKKGTGSYYHPTKGINMGQTPGSSSYARVWRHEFGHHVDDAMGRMGQRIRDLPSVQMAINMDAAELTKPITTNQRPVDGFMTGKQLDDAADAALAPLGMSAKDVRALLGPAHSDIDVAVTTNYVVQGDWRQALNSVNNRIRVNIQKRPTDSYKTMQEREKLKYDFVHDTGHGHPIHMLADMAGGATRNRVGWGHTDKYYKDDPSNGPAEVIANYWANAAGPGTTPQDNAAYRWARAMMPNTCKELDRVFS